MKLGFLQDVYEQSGPFATVYLDTSSDVENAPKEVGLRWRSARESLADQGADEATLQAIEERIGEHQWRESGRRGQLVVAAQGRVLLNDELPQPPTEFPADEQVFFGPLPHLMPYLRMRSARIPHVVAVVDHSGADITSVNAARESDSTTVESGGVPLRKSHTAGEGNEQRHHHAVEERWQHNAADMAAEIETRALRISAEAIVLAGDVQQRKLVQEQLRKGLQDMVVQTGASSRDRKESGKNLDEEVSEVVRSAVESRVDEMVREFERERGEHDRAVEGWEATVGSLQRGQVRTLLRTPTSGGAPVDELYIGPGANEVALEDRTLREMGVSDSSSAPADAAILRGLIGTDAEIVLVDADRIELSGGIGAVLRFNDPSTRH
ncbi:hypothetical protein DFQ14_10598 [Halopolyspora algeriensis]|uniref:Peptide subunit release factor 1 (ERF1) n=1 Tax=Halopolyspora algeriensis TaxID=1500506 RepID=A0A368VWQ5_9ACTN|nr:hypothetical protein [Halopolyspora algeriensis]RCW43953.1 hypothetical protein DFQ14_10598 [Halopolyspora algeriensis]TQM53544.1 hypothetical protein FHU43_1701 [Halopolyspora algeriensis]